MKLKPLMKNFFILLILAIVFIISILFAEKALAPDNSTFSGFYEEPTDSIDIAFIGGSHSMAAFSPAQIWMEQNLTSYNIYSWSQNPWTAYHYAIEALREQDIKVLVVDAFSFSYNQSYLPAQTSDETSNEFALSIPPSLNRLQLSLAIRQNQVVPLPLSESIPVIRYHSRWTSMEFSEIYDNLFVSNYSSNKGFGPIFTTEVFGNYNYSDMGNATFLENSSREYLIKLINLAEEEGVQLILTKTPYIMNPEDRGYLDEIETICNEHNIPFINYLKEDLILETGFNYETDMAEHAHINYLGAEKLSAHIGEYIKENYLQSVVYPEETIERWDAESAIEQRDIDNWDIKLSPSFAELAAVLSQKNGYTTIITAHGDLTTVDSSHIVPALNILNIDADLLSNTDTNELFVFENGDNSTNTDILDRLNISANVTNDKSSIVFDDIDYSYNRVGFNVVVFDNIENEVVHSVSFATEHGFDYYTT